MKLKNFAMITEDKVFRKLKKTPIFCIADDLYKVFDAQMAKYTFNPSLIPKNHFRYQIAVINDEGVCDFCHLVVREIAANFR